MTVSPRRVKWLVAAICLSAGASYAAAQTALPPGVVSTIQKMLDIGTSPSDVRYFDSSIDLSGDGEPEILVYLVSPLVCGTGGCNLLVFSPERTGYRLVANMSVTRTPIRASSTRSSGWRNLIVRVGGGGGRSGDVELEFDGKSYPRNPTVLGPRVKPTTALASEMLIDGPKSMDEGKLLKAAGSTRAKRP